jgi:hypothetical protein
MRRALGEQAGVVTRRNEVESFVIPKAVLQAAREDRCEVADELFVERRREDIARDGVREGLDPAHPSPTRLRDERSEFVVLVPCRLMRTNGRLAADSLPKPKDRYKLGSSDLRVSPFCLGATTDPRSVSAAFDAGINFFFVSADMHWPIYDGVRRGIAMLLERGGGVRDDIVVGVVSYVTQPEFCFAPFLEALAAIPKLDRIDLTIMGGVYAPDFMVRAHQYGAHRRGVVPGARSVGASFHDRPAVVMAINHGMIDIAFSRYNPAHSGAAVDLFPHLVPDRSPLLYGFSSTFNYVGPKRCDELGLEGDQWRPAVTDYYRYSLTRREHDGVLCAPHTPKEIDELARAVDLGPLTDEETTYLRDLADLAAGRASLSK